MANWENDPCNLFNNDTRMRERWFADGDEEEIELPQSIAEEMLEDIKNIVRETGENISAKISDDDKQRVIRHNPNSSGMES